MICNVCGGTETHILDGIEYCQECNEQIKGSIDEVAAEESFTKKSLVSSSPKKAKKGKTRVLTPWLHFEAFNLILSKQVSALIELGCSKNLKTAVFYLWAKYLQKCESAFVNLPYEEEFIPRLSLFASRRDIELIYGEGHYSNLGKLRRPCYARDSNCTKPKIYKKKKPKTKVSETEGTNSSAKGKSRKKTSKLSFQCESSKSSTESVFSTEISSNENFEFSEQNSKEKMEKEKQKKTRRIMHSSHARKLKKNGFRRTDTTAQDACVSHMTLAKTLSFCQLGLLYTEDQMLLFDLIRLVNEGAVPYIDAPSHFPTAMQLQSSDFLVFQKSAAPDIKNVSFTTAQLMVFLELPKFNPPPLLPIAIRFVKDLNLPNDLIPVLKLLISKKNKHSDELCLNKKIQSKYHPHAFPLYEVQAMSMVALALKMLFVLDGKFEMEHSEIMTKWNSICKNKTFFVWKDWQQQMALKEYLFIKNYTALTNPMNRLDSLSADRINAGYPINLINQDLTTLLVPAHMRVNAGRIEFKSVIESLIDNNSIKKNPTSFPLQHELHRLRGDWKKMPLFKNTENMDFGFISKDFSHHKLDYRFSATSDEPISILLSSLYESVKRIYVTECDEFYENIIRTSKRYWYLDIKQRDLQSKKWINNFPPSFRWLFNFMCNYLQVDTLDFYKELRCIEHELLLSL